MARAGSVELKVLEAHAEDIYRGIARIDHDVMGSLSVEAGDCIEVAGSRATVARCLPADLPDEGRGIVRLDAITMQNAGTVVQGMVSVSKVEAMPAMRIAVSPLQETSTFGQGLFRAALDEVPVTICDRVDVPCFCGGRDRFLVESFTPAGRAVIVTSSTAFSLVDGGATGPD